MVLNEILGIDSKIVNVQSGAEIAKIVPDLIDHFETAGTPIMIGGGVLAHTIVGVAYDDATRNSQFLILDPHYTGVHKAASLKEIDLTLSIQIHLLLKMFWKNPQQLL